MTVLQMQRLLVCHDHSVMGGNKILLYTFHTALQIDVSIFMEIYTRSNSSDLSTTSHQQQHALNIVLL